jgi:hypothetical protein
MKWRWIVGICYATPPTLAVAMVVVAGALSRTRHIGSFPVRMDGFEFIVWRYDRRWIEIELGWVVLRLLILDLFALLSHCLVLLVVQLVNRHRRQLRGFEVLPVKKH